MDAGIEIVEGAERMDFALVHDWLTNSYWSPGISREKVERAAANSSLIVGAFDGEVQVGYLRVISDKATFGWLCDVIVSESHRGRGIGRAMVNYALEHPEHQGFRRWCLATKDAHGVYAECGFQPLIEPQRWMIHLPG